MNTFQIISSLVIPLIAIITAIIAFQQFYINKIKLRHELYERRAKVYREVLRYISLVVQKGQTNHSDLAEFWSNVGESEFLFDQKIIDFLESIYTNGLELEEANEYLFGEMKLESVEERRPWAKKKSSLVKWFFNQLQTTNDLFRNHLELNETVSVNFKNRGYYRLIAIIGILSSLTWVIYYSSQIFCWRYIFNNLFIMYSIGIVLSFLIPFLIYRIIIWLFNGFRNS